MAAALWALLAALAGVALGPGPAGASQVPLLVWSTERALWPPQDTPGGQVLSEDGLERLLAPGLQRGPRTVLLFLQDQLRLEDFTAFGGVFGNEPGGAFSQLQAALHSAGSALSLPAVSGAAVAALPPTLQRLLGAPPPLSLPGGALGGLRLNRSDPAVLLVGLPHSRSSLLGPKEALSSNDAVLGEVLQVLQEEQVPYTAMLTARSGRAPPVPGGLSLALSSPRRTLLGVPGGVPEHPPLRWPPRGDPQMLLWAQNLSVTFGGQHRDLTPLTFGEGASVDLGGSSWSPQEARFVLQYKEVFGDTLNITFLLRRAWFPVSGRPWAWLAEVGVSRGGSAPARFGVRGGAAPSPLGWRCAEFGTPGPLLLPLPPLEPTQRWGLSLRQMQIQAFNVSGGVFGAASDCAEFFSAPVWMGLLSGGLLLGGLLLGGAILLGLRPMDRFDDPRGPPLPVPLGE